MQVLYDAGYDDIDVRPTPRRVRVLQLLRPVRLARPRPRQRRGLRRRDGCRHLEHQRQRVDRATSTAGSTTTSPTSTPHDALPLLRPRPGGRRDRPSADQPARRSRSSAPTTSTVGSPNDPAAAEAGAAVLAGAVKQLRAENPNTVFAAAGDLIGASTFESFIQQDKPTIDALNAAGLDVSVGGQPRVRPGLRRPGQPRDGALRRRRQPVRRRRVEVPRRQRAVQGDRRPGAAAPTWIKDFGGVKVGFVGAVTEHLPELVSPAGIADIEVTDIVEAANEEADELKAGRCRHRHPARPRGRGHHLR